MKNLKKIFLSTLVFASISGAQSFGSGFESKEGEPAASAAARVPYTAETFYRDEQRDNALAAVEKEINKLSVFSVFRQSADFRTMVRGGSAVSALEGFKEIRSYSGPDQIKTIQFNNMIIEQYKKAQTNLSKFGTIVPCADRCDQLVTQFQGLVGAASEIMRSRLNVDLNALYTQAAMKRPIDNFYTAQRNIDKVIAHIVRISDEQTALFFQDQENARRIEEERVAREAEEKREEERIARVAQEELEAKQAEEKRVFDAALEARVTTELEIRSLNERKEAVSVELQLTQAEVDKVTSKKQKEKKQYKDNVAKVQNLAAQLEEIKKRLAELSVDSKPSASDDID